MLNRVQNVPFREFHPFLDARHRGCTRYTRVAFFEPTTDPSSWRRGGREVSVALSTRQTTIQRRGCPRSMLSISAVRRGSLEKPIRYQVIDVNGEYHGFEVTREPGLALS